MTTPARSLGLAAPTPWALRWLYLSIGAWTAAIGPFAAVILKAHGFDPAVIGLLSAAAAVTATLVGPALGHLGDVVIGRTAAYRLALTIAGGAAIVLLLPVPAWLFAPVVTSFAVFVGPFLALSDSLAMGALSSPERQYGAVRSLASLAFAIGVVIAGLIYDRAGYAAVPIVGLAWTVAVWLIVGQVPDRTRDRANRLEQAANAGPHEGRFGSISRAFAAEPRLYLLLPALTLLWAGIEGAILFVGIRIVDLGGEPSAVGLSFGLSAVFEIPGLLIVGWLSRRIGLPAILLLASLAFGLCVLAWALLSDPSAIIATRVATGLGYGALVGGSVLVISRLLPLELQSTGQALMVAASVGLGTVFGSIIGGLLYETLGATAFFVAAGSMTIAGGGLVFATLVSTPSGLRR